MNDGGLRELALSNLRSRDALIRVAAEARWNGSYDYSTSSRDYSFNIAALDKLDQDDVAAFEAVIETSSIERVLFEAARRAGDSPVANGFLIDTFMGRSDLYLRLEADEERLARSYAEKVDARHKMSDLRVRAAECMCDRARLDQAVQSGLRDIVQDTNGQKAWTRARAAKLLADPDLARQYSIASRLVGLGSGEVGPGNAEACREIADPEVVGFFLQHFGSAGGRPDIAGTALSSIYSNIDPNSEVAFEALCRRSPLAPWVKGASEYAEALAVPEWGLLERVTDRGMLRRLAGIEGAPAFVRFKACEMAGGHDFADANCACTVCGYEDHRFDGKRAGAVCSKCGARIVHTVSGGGDLWTSSERIEHTDGTTATTASVEWQGAGAR